MRNLIIAFALMFSAFTFGQMSFSIENLDLMSPIGENAVENTNMANIGWFMTDDIMVSFGMQDWERFSVAARYYTGFAGNMFVQANTNAFAPTAEALALDPEAGSTYTIGAAVGWTKALGIWKLQFEPMIVLDNVQDFTPHLAWGLRFNL